MHTESTWFSHVLGDVLKGPDLLAFERSFSAGVSVWGLQGSSPVAGLGHAVVYFLDAIRRKHTLQNVHNC